MDISLNDFSSPTEVLLDGLERKSWWKRRSPFEQILLIALLGAGIIIFGCFLYIIIRPSGTNKVCDSAECLQAATQILDRIDETVNPCENFFQFTCGKILKEKKTNWETRPSALLDEEVKKQLLRIVNEPMKDQDPYDLKLQKKIFSGCINEPKSEQNSLETFKQLLEKLNGWPMVVGNNWKGDQFDWVKTTLMLRNEGYYHRTFLRILVGSIPFNYQTYALRIEPPAVKGYTKTEIYKKYTIEVAVLFGANESFAETETDDMYKFNEELFQIVKNNYEENLNSTVFTIAEYQNQDTKINWLEFLNAYVYPIGKVTKDDTIVFEQPQYMQQIYNLIEKTPTRVVSNFMIWKALDDIMPFISKDIWNKYTCQLGTKQKRLNLCYYLIRESPIVHYEYARRRLPEKSKDQIQKMFENIKSKFGNYISQISWAPSKFKEQLQNKIKNLTVNIGSAEESNIYSLTNFGKQENLDIDFFKLYLYEKVRTKNIRFFQLFTNISRLGVIHHFLLTETQVFSFMDENVVAVPVGILQDIYYQPKRPMYMNYGVLGKIIGSELVYEAISIRRQDKVTQPIWSDKVIEAFENRTQCFLHNKNDKVFSEALYSYLNELKVSLFLGIDITYEAYRDWARDNEEQQLVGMDYTPNQLFWISSAMDQCFGSISEEDFGYQFNFLKDNILVRSNPDFAKDFNCPLNSPMNPSDKCYV